MCLTIPGKIESVKKNKAGVLFGDKARNVNLCLVKAKKGDYILAQNGFAIRKITKKQAQSILQLFKH